MGKNKVDFNNPKNHKSLKNPHPKKPVDTERRKVSFSRENPKNLKNDATKNKILNESSGFTSVQNIKTQKDFDSWEKDLAELNSYKIIFPNNSSGVIISQEISKKVICVTQHLTKP